MGVGFNNKNNLHIALNNEFLKDIEWMIEANSNEVYNLWLEWKDKYNWVQVCTGNSYKLLELDVKVKGKRKSETLPVYISFTYWIINGHKICFYCSDSLLSHYGYIESFIKTHFQRTHDKYTRWNHTDSRNFHNCINYLDTIDVEPRNTIYKPTAFYKGYHIFNNIKI